MKVLFLGAHTDDIEHGAGGLLSACMNSAEHQVQYLTFSRCLDLARNDGIEADQNRVKLYLMGKGVFVQFADFKNKRLHEDREEIREMLEGKRDSFNPDLVLTHWTGDLHQDHKTVAEETLRVFRNTTVLSYQIIHSCPGFAPNYFVPMSEENRDEKIKLLSMYETQIGLYYNNPDVIRAKAMYLGADIRREYAEGFIVNRIIDTGFLCAQ